ncbi:response regulator [Argonema antarcticum]|uniref:response regulator n=1 Tax=Argonema antarcticum TaxID=2942763 RepID=UPI00308422EF
MATYKVLVIDDSLDSRKLLRCMLPADNVEIIEAKNGQEGLNLIHKERPSLILLDFILPKVSGWEVFQHIQADNELQKIPLVVMSGRIDEVTHKIPQPFEYFEFMLKPFDKNHLFAVIKSAIAKAKLRKKLATTNEIINNNLHQPREYDAVLGGQNTPPVNAVVLGGLEGVQRRLASPVVDQRAIALKEALNYGEAGLDLVIKALKDAEYLVQRTAYSLLRTRTETTVKQAMQNYNYRLYEFLDFINTIEGNSEKDYSTSPSLASQSIVKSSDNYTIIPKILMIHHSMFVPTNTRNMLLTNNLQFIEAKDGKQGIELLNLERAKLSLILLHFTLAKISGLDIIQYIQADAELCKIPLVVTVGCRKVVSAEIPEPFEKFECLTVPWDRKKLIDAIKSAIIKVM